MKSSFSVKIVVWICNLTLFLLALLLLFGMYYYAKIPSFIAPDIEGVSTYRMSQTLLGDSYLYERVTDNESGTDVENYYFASRRHIYKISDADTLALSAQKINRDLSSTERTFLGFKQKTITVTEPAGDFPVRYAAPAISLDKEEFISYARANVVHTLFVILYGMAFLWFLRKFIAGLRVPDFFTRTNAFYLKITAWLAIAAPFLMWLWNSVIRPDLFADYRFENATGVSSGFSQPLLMLLFGLVLLAIAWSFEHGVKLQKEQELTI